MISESETTCTCSMASESSTTTSGTGSSAASGRFASVGEEDISRLLADKDSKSTSRLVKYSVLLFRNYLTDSGLDPNFESLSNEDLNTQLRTFYASARTKNGKTFKKSTLNTIRFGLAKHMKQEKNIDISEHPEFKSSRDVYMAVLSDMKHKGVGAVAHNPPISQVDLVKLYSDKHTFNTMTPAGLQNKVWFEIMFYLCRRGKENLRGMTKETFAVSTDSSGRKFIFSKRDEADQNHIHSVMPDDTVDQARIYEIPGSSMCPVLSFEKYISKICPENEDLWQRPVNNFTDQVDNWYVQNAPLGKNHLSSMMTKISKLAKLNTNYTNHSVRTTCITLLDDAGFEARHIMGTTGHRSETSIRTHLQRLSDNKKREISETLSSAVGISDLMPRTSSTPSPQISEHDPATSQSSGTAAASSSAASDRNSSGKDVVRNIYLLNQDMETVPLNKWELTQNGRKHAAFEIKSEDTDEALRERIETIFEDKIGHLPQPRFEYVKAERNSLFLPIVSPGTVFDGAALKKLVGQGQIYIRATGIIPDKYLTQPDERKPEIPCEPLEPPSIVIYREPRSILRPATSYPQLATQLNSSQTALFQQRNPATSVGEQAGVSRRLGNQPKEVHAQQELYHKMEDSSMGKHLLVEFYRLWKLGQLCDVRLQLPNGTMLNAHRLVLAAHSEYFHTVIDQAVKQNTQDVPVVFVDSDISMMSNLLQYMYTGEISVSSSGVQDLYHQAEKYSMLRLVALCKKLKGISTVKPGGADRTSDSSLMHEDSVPMRWEYNSHETPQDTSSLYYSELCSPSDISESADSMQEVSRVFQDAPVSNISQSRHPVQEVSSVDLGIVKQEKTDSLNDDTGCDRSSNTINSSVKSTNPVLPRSHETLQENKDLDRDRLQNIVIKNEPKSDNEEEMVNDKLMDSHLRRDSETENSAKRGQAYDSPRVPKRIKTASGPVTFKTEDMSDTPIK